LNRSFINNHKNSLHVGCHALIKSCTKTYEKAIERIKKSDGDMRHFYVANKAVDDLVKLCKKGGNPIDQGKDADTIAGLRVVKGKC
jgi:hypothetical protein